VRALRATVYALVTWANNLGKFGRWAFVEFTQVFEIEAELGKLTGELVTARAA